MLGMVTFDENVDVLERYCKGNVQRCHFSYFFRIFYF